jgi:hypothetical protein
MTFVNWKLTGCLALAGMLMLPLAAEAKNKPCKAQRAAKHATLRLADLPQAAAAAIVTADKDAKVHKIVKVQGKGHGKHAGKTFYVAHLTKGHQRATIKVSAAGKVVRQPQWHDRVAKGKGHRAKAA